MFRIIVGLFILALFVGALVWLYRISYKQEKFVSVATGQAVSCRPSRPPVPRVAQPVLTPPPPVLTSLPPVLTPSPPPRIDKALNDAKLIALNKQFPLNQRLDAVRVILQRIPDPEERDYYFRFLIRVGQESQSLQDRVNAIDILGHYNHPATQALLERLRRAEEEKNRLEFEYLYFLNVQPQHHPGRRRPDTPRPPLGIRLHPFLTDEEFIRQLDQYLHITRRGRRERRTVYEDSQNVHNTTLNKTMLTAVQELVERYPSQETRYPDLSSLNPKEREKAEASIQRILGSPEKYNQYTLRQVYNSLCQCIEESPHKQDMWKTLTEELIRMNGKCNTGHVARLITVLAGYDTPVSPSSVSVDDEIYATLSHGLNKVLSQPEHSHLLEQLVEEEKPDLIAFVDRYIQEEKPNLEREYQNIQKTSDIQKSLVRARNKYLGLGRESQK